MDHSTTPKEAPPQQHNARHEQITLLNLARTPSESHTPTFSTHALRLGSSSLSHVRLSPLLQALRCKIVQNSPPPLDVGNFLTRTSINRLCSCTPSGLLTRRHSLLVGARTVVSYTDTWSTGSAYVNQTSMPCDHYGVRML
jgi:hypothetical protein